MHQSHRSRLFADLRASTAGGLRIERNAKADDEVDIYLYEEIGFWGVTAQQFQRDLTLVTASRINLHLSSPGGDVFDGIAIHNLLRDHAAEVVVRVDGLAASIASVIAMAGDRIVMNRHSTMMIHDPWAFVMGDARDMQKESEVLDRLGATIAGIYAERGSGTADDWRGRMLAETWYTAQEAVDAGLADEVEETSAGVPDAEDRFDLSTYHFKNTPAHLLQQQRAASARAASPAAAAPADTLDIELERARVAVATAELGGK